MDGMSTGLSLLSAYADDDMDEPSDTEQDNRNYHSNNTVGMLRSDPGARDKLSRVTIEEMKLPVPGVLLDMFSASCQTIEDNPDEHDGRQRSFPHLRGNWASFLYINYSENQGLKWIVDHVKELSLTGQEWLKFPAKLNTETNFHLSLSKTQVFRHHWIQPFVNSLSSKLKNFNGFEVVLDSVNVYVNEERSRTFLSLDAFPSDALFQLVRMSDKCLHEYDLLPYYDPPSFHVTFAWLLGDQEQWARNVLLPELCSHWKAVCEEEPSLRISEVKSIEFRTGNKIYTFPLRSSEELKFSHRFTNSVTN